MFCCISLTNNLGGEKMEQMKLETIAELMSKQSGEEVEVENVVKLPYTKDKLGYMRNDQFEVYVARTEKSTCLLYAYNDGRVHVYVH